MSTGERRRKSNLISGSNAPLPEPAAVYLQGVEDIPLGYCRREREWFEIFNLAYCAVHRDEGEAQGYARVLHPEGRPRFRVEDKEHSLVIRQTPPVHESPRPKLRRIGDFRMEGVSIHFDFHRFQFGVAR